jgi:hypothetical protein
MGAAASDPTVEYGVSAWPVNICDADPTPSSASTVAATVAETSRRGVMASILPGGTKPMVVAVVEVAVVASWRA